MKIKTLEELKKLLVKKVTFEDIKELLLLEECTLGELIINFNDTEFPCIPTLDSGADDLERIKIFAFLEGYVQGYRHGHYGYK